MLRKALSISDLLSTSTLPSITGPVNPAMVPSLPGPTSTLENSLAMLCLDSATTSDVSTGASGTTSFEPMNAPLLALIIMGSPSLKRALSGTLEMKISVSSAMLYFS